MCCILQGQVRGAGMGAMQILIGLVKIGAIGASLAFLVLSYWLLNKQLGQKDANNNPVSPSPEALKHIAKFRNSALIFLIIGVLSEFVLTNSVDFVRYLFRSELVRVRFDDWEFYPEKNMVAFGLAEDRLDTRYYLLPSEQNKYGIYIGIRKKGSLPDDQGRYDLLMGPYQIETLSRQQLDLTPEQLKQLGNACVEFTAFAIEKKPGGARFKAPLDVSDGSVHAIALHTAHACL
jgi:hypothetical protein